MMPELNLDELALIYVALGTCHDHVNDRETRESIDKVQAKIGAVLAELELEAEARARGILI